MTDQPNRTDNDLLKRADQREERRNDHFNRLIINEFTDLIDIPGEHDFTPERLRYYKDGSRRFLQYASDANYSETNTGHLLSPDPDQTLELRTAERAAYPVGLDVLPSMSRRSTQAPQTGDVIGGGYGVLDIDNFDPVNVEYAEGSDADGWFWYHTEATGLDEVILAGVRDGTIYYHTREPLDKAADILTLLEIQLNWYAVGPGVFRQYYSNISERPEDPMVEYRIGAVAADNGKSSAKGSHRVAMGVHQAAGNSGLACEVGSIGVKSSGDPNYQFKSKGHSMDLENTNTTLGQYQVCGAMRTAPDRPEIKLRIADLDIINTPGSSITNTRVFITAIDPSQTDFVDGDFETPVEHNAANSVLQEATDNTATGPFLDAGTADASGATLANTGTNPGGYQIGRESVTPEGTGAQTQTTVGEQLGNRALYDTDYALILVDSDTAGTCEVDINTRQNS